MNVARSFVDQLSERITADPLESLVRRVADHEEWWSAHVRFNQESRTWHQLVKTDEVDVWLITWLRGHSTGFHNHGSSRAAFTVLQGQLIEQTVRPKGSVAERVCTAGSVVSVAAGSVHATTNESYVPVISIHAYSPPLRHCTVFDVTDGGVATASYSELASGRDPLLWP